MAPETIVLIALAIIGSGGVAAYYRVRVEAPKYTAEAQSIVITDLQREIKRLNSRITQSDEANEKLRIQNEVQQIRLDTLEGEMRILARQVNGDQ